MNDKYITLMSVEERKEFRSLFQRRNYDRGKELTAPELKRYDALLTLQAEEDYENRWKERYPSTVNKEDAIRHLKGKFETENII